MQLHEIQEHFIAAAEAFQEKCTAGLHPKEAAIQFLPYKHVVIQSECMLLCNFMPYFSDEFPPLTARVLVRI